MAIALLPGLALGQKADLTLRREAGPAGSFEMRLVSKSQHESVAITAKYKAEFLDGSSVEFSPLGFEMVVGNAPSNLAAFTGLKMQIERSGLAVEPDVAGMNLIYVVHQAAGYLPGRVVEPESRFAIEEKAGSSTFAGEGRFLGWEEEGKLARLRVEGVYNIVDGMPKLEINLDSWFDPRLGRVVRAEGTVSSVEMRKGSVSKTEMELRLSPLADG